MIQDYTLEVIQLGLLQDRAALRAAVEAIPESKRTVKPAPDRWSVAEILEHVAIVNSRIAAMIVTLAPSAPMLAASAMASPTDLDREAFRDRTTQLTAPDPILPQGRFDAIGAWKLIERAWGDVDAALVAASGRDLTKISRPHPSLGALDGYQWLWAVGAHEERHTAQIVELAETLKN